MFSLRLISYDMYVINELCYTIHLYAKCLHNEYTKYGKDYEVAQ